MAATAPQDLLTAGSCFNCYGANAVQMMRLSLLVNILTALNPMASTNPQTLLTYGKCFNCYGASTVEMIELALLNLIAIASGTGGGGFSNLDGHGSPVGVVTPDIVNQWYRDVDTDNYWWSTGLANTDWTPVV